MCFLAYLNNVLLCFCFCFSFTDCHCYTWSFDWCAGYSCLCYTCSIDEVFTYLLTYVHYLYVSFVVFVSSCVSPACFWFLILFLPSSENRYLVLSRCSYFVLDEVGGDHIQQYYSEYNSGGDWLCVLGSSLGSTSLEAQRYLKFTHSSEAVLITFMRSIRSNNNIVRKLSNWITDVLLLPGSDNWKMCKPNHQPLGWKWKCQP